MGIEQMRGNYGRYPPFLFGGLLLVCLISTVQWWSLATQNNDLIRQLEDLGEKFKLSSDQRDECLQLRMILNNRLKNAEDELAQVKVRLEKMKIEMNNIKTQESQKDEELKTQMKSAGDAQNAAAMCGSELESLKRLDLSKDVTIASLRIEKDKYSSEVDKKEKEMSKLKSELEAVKQELNVLKEDKQAPKAPISAANHVQRSQLKKQPLVEVRSKGMEGMLFHDGSVIVFDPPNAPRPSPRFSVTYLKGNQGGEQDDNHGGEREDGEEVPVLPEKKSLPLPKKLSTKSSVNYNEGLFNEKNKELEEKEEENDRKEENSQVKPPESPPKISNFT
ncbi:myosin heavy chain, clone 203-like isoform X1 [Hetaerina americana]|uniref:myosin heavy chain, clone 203-like isoform X1 n=1 Tax=Hetaerina americana TaxID=62018 RepID=UPI003A7F29ED